MPEEHHRSSSGNFPRPWLRPSIDGLIARKGVRILKHREHIRDGHTMPCLVLPGLAPVPFEHVASVCTNMCTCRSCFSIRRREPADRARQLGHRFRSERGRTAGIPTTTIRHVDGDRPHRGRQRSAVQTHRNSPGQVDRLVPTDDAFGSAPPLTAPEVRPAAEPADLPETGQPRR
jgi:hypothetical protein